VGSRVGVGADGQLAQVDTVAQQQAPSGIRHPEPLGDLHHRHRPGGARRERPPHHARALVRDEPARLRVAAIAGRGLPALPDARLGRPPPQVVEALDVRLALVLVDRGQDVALQAPAARARVDPFLGDDDAPAGGVDAGRRS
jgi:hypothetical protein